MYVCMYVCMYASIYAHIGLDIPEVDLVIHYELPQQMENFVHRTGRTGRATYFLAYMHGYMHTYIHTEYRDYRRWKVSYRREGLHI